MKNKKYIMYLVVSILVLTIGVSYAYFKARVNGEGKSISLRSKGIYVLYSGNGTPTEPYEIDYDNSCN